MSNQEASDLLVGLLTSNCRKYPHLQIALTRFSQFPETLQGVVNHAKLMSEWGAKINLVSDLELSSIIKLHTFDSVAAWSYLQSCFDTSGLDLVDVGSGNGFPGIVFSCLGSYSTSLLIEPRLKRIVFLEEVIRRSEVLSQRVKTRNCLVESYTSKPSDLVVTRATGIDIAAKCPQAKCHVILGRDQRGESYNPLDPSSRLYISKTE